ncbi:MAG: hypothetical protein ACTSYF_02415, partial [Promethearchaeota archaeon]
GSGSVPDCFENPTSGTLELEYEDPSNALRKNAAISWNSSTYNNATVMFGFAFDDISEKVNRTLIMNRTINFLNSTAKSILIVDDTYDQYGYYYTEAVEDLGFVPTWKTLYSKSFADIDEENTWYNTGLVPISISDLPKNSSHSILRIKIGLRHSGSLSLNPEPLPEIWLDNFQLFLKSSINPSDINLKMNDQSVVEESLGKGNYSQTFTTPITGDLVITNFTWTPNPQPNPEQDFYISFDCTSTISSTKNGETLYDLNPTKTGVNSITNSSENSSWNFYYLTLIPTGYQDHYLNISKPLDWNVTFVSEPLLPTDNLIVNCSQGQPGNSFFIVPTQNITNFPDGYWSFQASSPNYHDDLKTQKWNGTNWNNETDFFVGNKLRIMLKILNETGVPPDLSSFSANLTIIDPMLNTWYYNETYYSGIDGIIYFPNITINGTDTYGGIYEINVAWTNGEEVCFRSTTFIIRHFAQLILHEPTDAVIDAETTVTKGDLLLIRMRLNDTDKTELIKGSSLSLNWTDGSPVIKSFTDLGTGEYELVLDTAELPNIQNYTLLINSTNQYYNNDSYLLKLIVLADTLLTSPQFPRISEPWGDNITIDYYYNETFTGTGIENAIYSVEYPSLYTMIDLSNGHYQLELNTSSITLKEHLVNVSFQKSNFLQQNLTIKVNIHEKETKLIQDTITAVPHGDNVTIIVTYSTLDNIPITPDGDPKNVISLNNSLIYDVTYDDLGDKKYHITLNTSNLNKFDLINITAQKNKYYSQNLLSLIPYRDIFLDIVPLNSTFIELPNNITFSNFTIYLNDTEHDKPVNNANFTFLGFNEINTTFVSNGIYRICL